MLDKVLVTGVSGFLGGHVAVALLDAGYAVRGSIRSLAKADHVRETLARATASGRADNLELVALDLTRDEGWREAATGCRHLQHVASPFVTTMPADKDELIRPAVDGTRRALEAALAAGIERIVLTSSFAAVGYGHGRDHTGPFTEADWSKTTGEDVNAYTESKTRAELEAWSIMEGAGRRQDLVAVNPVGILGPLLDDDPGTSNAILMRFLAGQIPAIPRFSFSIVDVRDVAEVHLKAMESPAAAGQRLIAAAGALTAKQIADTLRAAVPERAGRLPRLELPDWFVRLIAPLNRDLRDNLDALGVVQQIDSRRAEALLGHPFITAEDSIVATAKSLIAHHLV